MKLKSTEMIPCTSNNQFSINPLFSSPIMSLVCDDFNADDEDLKFINVKENQVLKDNSNLTNYFLDKFNTIATDIIALDNVSFKISSSYLFEEDVADRSVVNRLSSSHKIRNSFWSGIFFHDEYDEDSALINFISPNQQLFDFWVPLMNTDKINTFNCHEFKIRPHKNLLLIFPSYLEHNFIFNQSNLKFLSFNIIPIGSYGFGDSEYNTNWIDNIKNDNDVKKEYGFTPHTKPEKSSPTIKKQFIPDKKEASSYDSDSAWESVNAEPNKPTEVKSNDQYKKSIQVDRLSSPLPDKSIDKYKKSIQFVGKNRKF